MQADTPPVSASQPPLSFPNGNHMEKFQNLLVFFFSVTLHTFGCTPKIIHAKGSSAGLLSSGQTQQEMKSPQVA